MYRGEIINPDILSHAQTLWDYHVIRQHLRPVDVIVLLSSLDIYVADHAADLFQKKLAPLIIISGGVAHKDDLLDAGWGEKTEARVLAERAISKGIPEGKILLEERATNTGENFQYTATLLSEHSINVNSALLVQKPYMLRRTHATAKIQWPDKETIVSGQDITFEDYLAQSEHNTKTIINIMVGDLQRIHLYPKKGFQIQHDIPDSVWHAFDALIAAGYNKHLIQE